MLLPSCDWNLMNAKSKYTHSGMGHCLDALAPVNTMLWSHVDPLLFNTAARPTTRYARLS